MNALFSKDMPAMTCCLLHPQYCVCSLIQYKKNENKCVIVAHMIEPLHHLELEKQVIFNPSLIGSYINAFMRTNKCMRSAVAFSLSGPSLQEGLSSTGDEKGVASICMETPSADESGANEVYYAAIKNEVLFQYKLLALHHSWPLIMITTRTAALWNMQQALRESAAENIIRTAGSCVHDKDLCASLRHEAVGLFIAGNTYEN